jgi:hypothetical protein
MRKASPRGRGTGFCGTGKAGLVHPCLAEDWIDVEAGRNAAVIRQIGCVVFESGARPPSPKLPAPPTPPAPPATAAASFGRDLAGGSGSMIATCTAQKELCAALLRDVRMFVEADPGCNLASCMKEYLERNQTILRLQPSATACRSSGVRSTDLSGGSGSGRGGGDLQGAGLGVPLDRGAIAAGTTATLASGTSGDDQATKRAIYTRSRKGRKR